MFKGIVRSQPLIFVRRPDFAHLSNTIDKLPKKKGLSRSLSQSNNPTHLSRSAESVF